MFTLSAAPTIPAQTPAQLSTIPVPPVAPWASRAVHSRWRPIQHGELAQTILEQADALGLEVHRHSWQTSGPGDTELFGSLDFSRNPCLDVPDGMLFSLGVRHSNAGRYALTLVTGARVIVCTNGMLVGEQVLSRRHTEDLDLLATVRRGLEASVAQADRVGAWVTRLTSTALTDPQADRLMMAAARCRVLSWSALHHVDRAWRRPPHEVFEARNAWSLYNAFTEVARERSPAVQLKAFRGLHRLFDGGALGELLN